MPEFLTDLARGDGGSVPKQDDYRLAAELGLDLW